MFKKLLILLLVATPLFAMEKGKEKVKEEKKQEENIGFVEAGCKRLDQIMQIIQSRKSKLKRPEDITDFKDLVNQLKWLFEALLSKSQLNLFYNTIRKNEVDIPLENLPFIQESVQQRGMYSDLKKICKQHPYTKKLISLIANKIKTTTTAQVLNEYHAVLTELPFYIKKAISEEFEFYFCKEYGIKVPGVGKLVHADDKKVLYCESYLNGRNLPSNFALFDVKTGKRLFLKKALRIKVSKDFLVVVIPLIFATFTNGRRNPEQYILEVFDCNNKYKRVCSFKMNVEDLDLDKWDINNNYIFTRTSFSEIRKYELKTGKLLNSYQINDPDPYRVYFSDNYCASEKTINEITDYRNVSIWELSKEPKKRFHFTNARILRKCGNKLILAKYNPTNVAIFTFNLNIGKIETEFVLNNVRKDKNMISVINQNYLKVNYYGGRWSSSYAVIYSLKTGKVIKRGDFFAWHKSASNEKIIVGWRLDALGLKVVNDDFKELMTIPIFEKKDIFNNKINKLKMTDTCLTADIKNDAKRYLHIINFQLFELEEILCRYAIKNSSNESVEAIFKTAIYQSLSETSKKKLVAFKQRVQSSWYMRALELASSFVF